MKRSVTLVFSLFSFAIIFAQPANDNCNSATTVTPNGTCYGGTTVAAADSWQGSVGCQGGGNHPDVWYTFTSTGSQAQFTITASAPWSGNVEVILVQGTCAGGFNIVGSQCGPSPLNATFIGLSNGTVYYYTISNANGGTSGPFQTCLTTTTPPTLAGQNCNNAAILCNSNAFSQPTSNAGFGSQEVNTANSCWGAGGERQSKWFKFTAGCSGSLEFNINPVNGNDDYDWALWNITSDPNGCTTKGNSIACNWSGCTGSTGISSCSASEPGVKNCGSATGGDPCGNGNFPRGWGNWSAPGGGASTCLTSTVNLVAGNVYALLVDNFSASNSGFSLTFGGACGGGTTTIGPNADFTYTTSGCGTYNFTKTCPTSNSSFLWQFGDGTTATTQNASHTYSTFGNFVITLQVTDALGCVTTYSQTINIVSTPLPTVTTPVSYCVGAVASPLTASGSSLLWYATSTGGVGSSIAPTPSTATAGITSYYVSQTIGGCESARVQIDVIVNPNVTPTFNPVAPICSGGTLSALPTTSLNGITGTWSPALNNTATTTYTFTPTVGQCAITASLTITVNSSVTPTFNAVAPICSGGTLSALPTTSLNGITGTWSPALNNTATTTYTFTPTVGQCATTASLTITVNSSVTPTFNAVAPICSGGTLSALPTTSLNGITGIWSPALNNTATTTYTFTPTVGQCATTASLTITVNSSVTPTFNSVAPICSGGTLTALPTTSLNGITGTWSPALNNTATTTYTFTPTVGQCATTASLTITVNSSVTPTFNPVAPICSGGTLSALPTTSLNGITGTWSPALNNTATTTYTFTPTVGQCATTASLAITVNSNLTPTFNPVAPICSGGTLSALPTTSLNGITGTWSPALNNTATTTYTFTPTVGQCATTASLTITVNSSVTPTFNAVAPICSGGTLSALPTTSLNGITGSWSPVLNNTATTTYTFTPTVGQCATTASLTITVNSNVTPTFNPVAPICSGGTLSALPTTSLNGIMGSWSPALNNTATTTYTFTPTVGQCATTASLTITVNSNVTPTFNPVAPICSGGTLSALPTTSLNGITGIWSPALNNTTTTTYTFTPTVGQCATTASLTITVNSNVTPTFNPVAPICSGGTLSALPTTSLNGITGIWSPALNNTATTTYTFTPTAGQCATTASLTITVNSNVTPTFNPVAPICSGGTLSALPTTSLNGITGTWSPALNNTVTTTYTFIPTVGQCATAASLTIVVNQILSPTINCGVSTTSSVTFTWSAVSGATGYNVSYQINTGAPFNIGAVGNVLLYQVSGLSGGDNVTISVTPTGGTCFVASSLSCAAISCLPPTANINYASPFCSNNSIAQQVSLTGTGAYTGGVYSALPGLTLNSTTGAIIPSSSVPGNYTVTYTVAAGGGCPGTVATTSVTIYSVTPSVSIVANTTSICTGGSVTFTATPTNGGTTPTYQWKINGVNVTGQTASTFTTTTLNNGDAVTVTMSSSDPCANPVTATSNPITITGTSVVPSVSITSSTTSICTAGSVTFTATPTNGGTTPTYQWKINGVNVTGQTASTFTTTTLNNGDVVTVTMSSSDPCANPVTATSNPITITATSVVPSVSITSSTTSICTAGSVTFTATPTNGGTTPTYQWKINGVNVTGQTASTFTTTTLNNGDFVTVTMSSSDPCANPVIASSNPITVTATLVIPSVSIASSTTSICTGGSVTFTATPINGGTTPTYQWKINGVNVTGQTASTFSTSTLSNGDVVTVTMSSSDPCANPVIASSNPITVTATLVIPSVSIASSTTSICTGGSVTFTATPTNGGTTPTYQWKINGVNVTGQTASTFATTTLNNADVVTVTMSSSDPCANPTNAASNTVAVTVNTTPALIITNPPIVCAPSVVDLTVPAITSGSSTGTSYSYWSDAANTIAVSNPNAVAASGTYYIRSQSAGGCFTTKPVTVTIESKIPGIRYPDITITMNTPVALQARGLQPNSTYQWSPNRGLNNFTNRDVVFSFDQKTEYLIAITSPAGCVTIDTQLVNIEITQSGIFVPRAWTPNGDGHNDLLFPLALNIVKINYFRIFNRWGQLMFETNTLNAGWNGIYKGKQQPLEVYTWTVEAVTTTGEIIRRSGNSVLIR